MLTALALAAVLASAPAQPSDLKLTNVRLTLGEFGPTREGNKLLPGDILYIAFDIEGLTINEEGTAEYRMAMEVTAPPTAADPKGRSLLKQEPRDQMDFAPLRGGRLPGRGFVTVGLDLAPGEYSYKLTVTDPKTKGTADLAVKFEVLKKEFAVVAVSASHDPKHDWPSPNSAQVGEWLFINYTIASFERDPKTKQPNVEIEHQIFDEKGKPVLVNADNKPAPLKRIQNDKTVPPVKDGDGAFWAQLPLYLNRPGKFVLEIKATDNVTKKTFTYKMPITVTAAN